MKKLIPHTKKFRWILVAVLCGACALLYFLPGSHKKSEPVISNTVATDVTAEEKLESVLSCIQGAGATKVMITYETGNEVVTASAVESQTSSVTETNGDSKKVSETTTNSSRPVTVGSGTGEDALVVVKKEPVIKGVIVIAEGAKDLSVRLNLQKAVETVLQVAPSQVEIFTMNKGES